MSTDSSRLGANIVSFARALRAAGIAIGSAEIADALRALRRVGLARRDDVRIALRSSLIRDPAHFDRFDRAFNACFRHPDLLARLDDSGLATPEAAVGSRRRLSAVAVEPAADAAASRDGPEGKRLAGGYSAVERLAEKDFDAMTPEEFGEAARLLRARLGAVPDLPSRRFRADSRGTDVDLCRSLQRMAQQNGELITLMRRRRQRRPSPLVLICDVSGSMSRYSRMFLQLAHALGRRQQTVHTFVFGTQLTNVSRALRNRDPDAALSRVAADVADWDGGTRIAACLRRFNTDWGRRVLAQNASVLLMTDGLERDAQADLEYQAARLHRSCRRLLWLNPMLRYERFEPKAFGIRAILPHVDRLLPAHSVSSLAAITAALATDGARYAAEQGR